MKTQEEELRERLATLNGSGGHACYCPRSVDGGCQCALKDEYVDKILALIQSELSSQREDLEAKHKEELVKSRQDEAADIHKLGFDIAMKDGAASMVVGGTGLHELLTRIERRHGKDIILHVAGAHNKLTKSKKGEE